LPRTANAATASTNITLRILLPGLHLRGHQTDLIDPGAVSDVDRPGDPLEVYGRVALDEDNPLGAGLENLLETGAQMRLIDGLAVDGQVMLGRSEEHTSELQSLRHL